MSARRVSAVLVCGVLASVSLLAAPGQSPQYRRFSTPEEAVQTLAATVKAGNLDELLAIFAPDGQELVASSDPATARQNREISPSRSQRAGASSIRAATDSLAEMRGNMSFRKIPNPAAYEREHFRSMLK